MRSFGGQLQYFLTIFAVRLATGGPADLDVIPARSACIACRGALLPAGLNKLSWPYILCIRPLTPMTLIHKTGKKHSFIHSFSFIVVLAVGL